MGTKGSTRTEPERATSRGREPPGFREASDRLALFLFALVFAWTAVFPSLVSASCPQGYATWLTDNLQIVKSKTLREISLPASHDAGMYSAHTCTTAGVGGPTACNTQTQQRSIGDQLSCGVRVFDLRPVYTPEEDFYTGHFTPDTPLGTMGCLGGSLANALSDIADFVSEHPQELVILQFSHYYDRKKDEWGFSQEVMSHLTSRVRRGIPTLVKSSSSLKLLDLSYEGLLSHGNVIALFEGVASDDWSTGILSTGALRIAGSYSNTNDFGTMKRDQFQKMSAYAGNPSWLFSMSWTLTQNATQAATCNIDPTGATSSIRDLAAVANKHFRDILAEQRANGKIANILYTDFVDGSSTLVSMRSVGITEDPGPATCKSDQDCAAAACARPRAGTDDLVCCPSGEDGLYAGYYYCYGMSDGTACWSDAMCASGYCKGNAGGLQKGVCTSRLGPGKSCETDSDCLNHTCARPQAGTDRLVCCPSGKDGLYAGYYYCYGMPRGNRCWSDAMCASGTCSGNWGGLRQGTCS